MTTTVKYFHSAMSGAPTLSGTAGTLIDVLDACLVNGFNLKTVDSLVVASNIATATMNTGVGAFEVDAIVLIAGATPGGLNGEKRILSVGANTITFDATGIGDQTATGTISAKLAPVGWTKAYSGTNLAAYRSADVTGTQLYMRVDDTGTTNGRVVGYETMSDVNTGTGPFPTNTQVSGGLYWPKANAANGTARGWTVIADSRTVWVHLHTATSNIGQNGAIVGFGDFNSLKSGDTYGCMILGTITDLSANGSSSGYSLQYVTQAESTVYGAYTARSYTALGSSVGTIRRAESHMTISTHSGATAFYNYPNGADNSIILSRIMAMENVPALRGFLRGPMVCPQIVYSSFNWRDKVTALSQTYLALRSDGSPASTSSGAGVMFFDITGPW